MDDASQKVIADIREKIQGHLNEVVKLKKAANMIADLSEERPIYTDLDEGDPVGPSRADAYYGKPLATAVREYLEFRRQAVAVDDILSGLTQGGFDFDALGWATGGRLRSLAMSIAKNNAVFHRLPNGMWGLNSWYSEAIQRRKARSKGKESEGAPGESGDQQEAANRRAGEARTRKRAEKRAEKRADKTPAVDAEPADGDQEKGPALS